MRTVRFRSVEPGAVVPSRNYKGDAGYDVYALQPGAIQPGAYFRVRLGVTVDLPTGWFGVLSERSSQSQSGVFSIGNVVDEGYEGEISITLVNLGSSAYRFRTGDKIGQLLLVPRYHDVPREVTLPMRGSNGFGSTGQRVFDQGART